MFLLLVKKTLKKLRGTAIETKFAPLYNVLFMAKLEQEILREVELTHLTQCSISIPPENVRKPLIFLTFSGCIEKAHLAKMGYSLTSGGGT